MSLCLAFGFSPAHADPNEGISLQEVAQLIDRLYGSDAKLDAAVTKFYGVLPPQKAALLKANLRAGLFHPKFAPYMQQVLQPLMQAKASPQEAVATMSEVLASLQARGLQRLDAEKQAAFVRHTVRVARWLSPADCKRLFLGQASTAESAMWERQYVVGLPLPQFEAITSLYRAAIDAELSGYPDVRQLNKQQALSAEQAYDAATARRLRANFTQQALRSYSADPASAPAADVCGIASHSAEAMLDLNEPYRTWQLMRFAQSMQ